MINWIKFSDRKPALGRLCLVQDADNRFYVGRYNPKFLNDFEDRSVGLSLSVCSAPVVCWAYVKASKASKASKTS
jgi:hypothetical protein